MMKHNRGLILRHANLNQKGLTLVEITIVMFLMGVMGLGAAATLLSISQNQKSAETSSGMVEITSQLQRAVAGTGTIRNAKTACGEMFEMTSAPAFGTRTGETNIRIQMPDGTMLQPGQMATNTGMTINRIFLTDNILVNTNGSANMYVSSLVMEYSAGNLGAMAGRKRRNLATMSISMDGNTMMDCNAQILLPPRSELCQGFDGLRWDEQLQACVQDFETGAGTTNEFNCPAGTWKRVIGGQNQCVPGATDCGFGKIAKGFRFGIMNGCGQPPTGPAVSLAAAPWYPPMPGTPEPPQRLPEDPPVTVTTTTVPNTFIEEPPPETIQNFPPPTTPPNPPASCVDGSTVNEIIYNLCSTPGFSCPIGGISSAPSQSCVDETPVEYETPDLKETPPSQAPIPAYAPPTCMCAGNRINPGEYCVSCVKDYYGYGSNRYTHVAYICGGDGTLTLTSGTIMPDEYGDASCTNTYRRGNCDNITGICYQDP